MHKIILITGSTDGIGKGTALKLAIEGHTVYIHGRNEAKVNTVVAEIKEVSKNKNVKGFVADFSNLEAVKKLAKHIKNNFPKIDVLINNAGVFKSPVEKTNDGLDIRMAVNYLAPYIFTDTILSNIKNSETPRIINLSSAAQAPVSETVLSGKVEVSGNNSYAQSKLALTMWSFHLAKQEPKIVVIAVNPGSLLNTKMANEAYGQHWSSAEKGVNILYNLAISDSYKNDSGKYFDNDKGVFSKAHTNAYNDELISALLANTDKLI